MTVSGAPRASTEHFAVKPVILKKIMKPVADDFKIAKKSDMVKAQAGQKRQNAEAIQILDDEDGIAIDESRSDPREPRPNALAFSGDVRC